MNMFNKIIFGLLTALVLTGAIVSVVEAANPYQLSGYVRDADTNNAISGATVTTDFGATIPPTGSSGFFFVGGDYNLVDGSTYHVTASASGYLSDTKSFIYTSGAGGSSFEFYLEKAQPSPVPNADFSGTPLSGTAPLTVQFTDLSTNIGSKEVWSWDFGDGTTLSGNYPNPTHTYTSTGTFTVELVIAASGDWTVTKTNYITVSGSTPTPTPTPVPTPTPGPESAPIAGFTATPLSGNAPLSVQFTDESTGAGISAWSWNFGDGGSSNARNPSHTYSEVGTYNVMLTVTGTGGSDTEIKVAYITVTTPPQPTLTPIKLVPIVNFTGTPRNGTATLTVQFTDLSTNNPTSWNWSFGDGNYSNVQNPLYNYTAAGNYTVSLTASNGDGSGNKTVIDYIIVETVPAGDGGTTTERTGIDWWWLLLLLLIPIAGLAIYYYGFVKNK